MNNPELVDLNFRKIVNYGQPRVMFHYNAANRPRCVGYCTSCEDKGLAELGELDLMSHGCDSADFEALLGPLPVDHAIAVPVLFLLEDPGGDSIFAFRVAVSRLNSRRLASGIGVKRPTLRVSACCWHLCCAASWAIAASIKT